MGPFPPNHPLLPDPAFPCCCVAGAVGLGNENVPAMRESMVVVTVAGDDDDEDREDRRVGEGSSDRGLGMMVKSAV